MLYVSTRNKSESFTPFRVLRENCAPDGGMFIPFQLQPLKKQELLKLFKSNFHDACAQLLNLLFSTKLTAADVAFGAGRNIVSYHVMSHKMVIAETWHNPGAAYDHLETALYSKLTDGSTSAVPAWVRIAIRTAVLFGIYTHLRESVVGEFDIAVGADDSASYLGAYYARQLGLPIRNIIIGCDEKSGLWDLIHKGEFATASAEPGVEGLVCAVYGQQETSKLLEASSRKRMYFLGEEQLPLFDSGLFAAVVGNSRLDAVVGSVWRTNQYIITPDTAIPYSALQDYRAKTGQSRDTLIFADRNPLDSACRILAATGLTYEQLSKQISALKE